MYLRAYRGRHITTGAAPTRMLRAQLDALCAASVPLHGSLAAVPTEMVFVLPVESMRPDGALTSPLDAWRTTPARVGALLRALRADGFVARLFRSSGTNSADCPHALYLELGVAEDELIDDAEALQVTAQRERARALALGARCASTPRARADAGAARGWPDRLPSWPSAASVRGVAHAATSTLRAHARPSTLRRRKRPRTARTAAATAGMAAPRRART